MSKTPRTDNHTIGTSVDVIFARQLETELADKEKQLAEARAEIERLNKGIKIVQSAFKNYKNAAAIIARTTLKKAQILSASCNSDAVDSERAANEILTTEIERKSKLIEQMKAEIERLKSEHEDSLRRAKDNAVSLSGTVTEYAGELLAKDKLIEQLIEALLAARGIIEEADPLQPDKVIGQIDAVLQSITGDNL